MIELTAPALGALGAGATAAAGFWCGHLVGGRRRVGRVLDHAERQLDRLAEELRSGRRVSRWSPAAGQPPAGPDEQRLLVGFAELVEVLHAHPPTRPGTEGAAEMTITVDGDTAITRVSGALGELLGWEPAAIGRPLVEVVHEEDRGRLVEVLDTLRAAPSAVLRSRLRVLDSLDRWRLVEFSGDGRNASGGTLRLAVRDVTVQVGMAAELRYHSTHDILTGLPNRAWMMRRLGDAVSCDLDTAVSVVMIDLDRFKEVNDHLGHSLGDLLLSRVGTRLLSVLRPDDLLARMGDDEFAVLLIGADQGRARSVAERLATELEAPFELSGTEVPVSASIGVATRAASDAVDPPAPALEPGAAAPATEGTEDAERRPCPDPSPDGEQAGDCADLVRRAEAAMYQAKLDGTGITVFDAHRDTESSRARWELSAQLRTAIAQGELVLHYQPVINVLEGTLAGVEALVRWQHPTRGLLGPQEFLPLAEETGQMVQLSKAVLEQAVAQAATWQRDWRPLTIAVNVSPRWLRHADMPDLVAETLDRHRVPAQLLRLEIVESVVLAQPEEALSLLQRLRDMGIGLSLDDFGTGYSSMAHLRSLPVDALKVDRAFVKGMCVNAEDAVIVRAAVELANNLGLSVVAEGIEDAATLTALVSSGCSLAQGFYFSKGLPAEELVAWAEVNFPTRPGTHAVPV